MGLVKGEGLKPTLIISHTACEQPGYLCEYLHRQGVAFNNISIESDGEVPEGIDDISSIVILGSPFSVNDPYPWINDEIDLIKLALMEDMPILGICFGAQLIAKALGGEVCSASSMQIGWHSVRLTQQSKSIFGDHSLPDSFLAFEWHGDTFSLPSGSTPLFYADCINNQGFLYRNCLALQFHPEITATMVHEWLERYADCLEESTLCNQNRPEILKNMNDRLIEQRMVADKLFGWWLDRVYECSAG